MQRLQLEQGEGWAGYLPGCWVLRRLCSCCAHAALMLRCAVLRCAEQVKALDTEVVEAQPYHGALDAADDMRAMLEGSRQVNARRGGAGALPAVVNAAQVGAAAWPAGGGGPWRESGGPIWDRGPDCAAKRVAVEKH